jgi:ABC-type antimicrobial peptide transport system permease subunit
MNSYGGAQLLVRSTDPPGAARAIDLRLTDLSPDAQPNVFVVADRFALALERPRRLAALAAGVAAIALALSIVGLVGVTSFVVRTRSRELSIRMALGARAGDVIGLLVRDAMRPVVMGLVAGLVVALLAGRLIAGLLYGISSRDPLAIALAAAILMLAAVGAVFVPTARAVRVDPARVLRDS